MRVVFQVEGGGQCPGEIAGPPRLDTVRAGPEAHLFREGDGIAVALSS
ncbi:MAG: hypothetical protein ACYCO9_00375 [Streptosporangiaceae bacterium]